MKRYLVLGLSCLVACAAPASEIARSLNGDLVSLSGKRTHRFEDAAIANTKYFGIYFSAGWCAPCRAFSPKLVEWYNANKAKYPDFEIILVSSDHSEDEMDAYMASEKMQWPALKFTKKASNKSITRFAGGGIPCLVFIDADGNVLSDSYVGGNYVGPSKVLADIKKTLANSSGKSDTATPAPTGSTTKPKSPQGSNFDDAFKKKAQ